MKRVPPEAMRAWGPQQQGSKSAEPTRRTNMRGVYMVVLIWGCAAHQASGCASPMLRPRRLSAAPLGRHPA